MDGFLSIFSLMLAGYGIYFIYQWFQITIQKKPVDVKNFMPTDMTLDKCSDVPAFTAYIAPWLLFMGAALVIYAVASYFLGNSAWFIVVIVGFFSSFTLLYILLVRHAQKRFWPDLAREREEKKREKRKRK